jgi:hypothetical protein
MVIPYSRLAMSLESLEIILPIPLHLLSLAFTFATVTYNYHTYGYENERRRTFPYTMIAVSVNGYVSRTGSRDYTPVPTRHIIKSTIETTAFHTQYRSMSTASTDLDHFNIQLSPLMTAEKSSETNCRTRLVTSGEEDIYPEYRKQLFLPANKGNRIR